MGAPVDCVACCWPQACRSFHLRDVLNTPQVPDAHQNHGLWCQLADWTFLVLCKAPIKRAQAVLPALPGALQTLIGLTITHRQINCYQRSSQLHMPVLPGMQQQQHTLLLLREIWLCNTHGVYRAF